MDDAIDSRNAPNRPSRWRRLRAFAALARRQLAVLGVAGAAFLVIAPLASESNPEYEEAQRFLDEMVLVTTSIREGSQPPQRTEPTDQISWLSESRGDGSLDSVVLGHHEGRCFLIHWRTPGVSGPRAGVLDPALECAPTSALMATMPTPPLVEAFPGTVPPLDANELLTPIGAGRHNRLQPFPAERTRWWFLPAILGLFAIALWHVVGVTILWLRQARIQRRRGATQP